MAGKCFVPDCMSGLDSVRKKHKKEKKKHPQMLSAPKHWTMLQIWKHIIPATDKKFSITDKICELHFPDDYVIKFHEIPTEDGKIMKLERNYAKLKPGAIPTIFQNFPQYSKMVEKIADKMRKEFPLHIPEMDIKIDDHMESYLKRISEIQKKLISNSEGELYESEENYSMECMNFENMNADKTNLLNDRLDSEENSSDIDFDVYNKDNNVYNQNINSELGNIEAEEGENESQEVTFDMLLKNFRSITKPNSSWSVTAHGTFIMCAKWNKDYIPVKRVIIDSDLNIKVFLNDTEVATYNNCISDVSDVSNVLSIVDK